jgi:hypothetical protein
MDSKGGWRPLPGKLFEAIYQKKITDSVLYSIVHNQHFKDYSMPLRFYLEYKYTFFHLLPLLS